MSVFSMQFVDDWDLNYKIITSIGDSLVFARGRVDEIKLNAVQC